MPAGETARYEHVHLHQVIKKVRPERDSEPGFVH